MRISHLLLIPLVAVIFDSSRVQAASICADDNDGSALSCAADGASTSQTTSSRSSATLDIPLDSSILQWFNPKYLEPQAMADIKSNLLAGKAVILRNAFKTDFAEYVHEHLAADEREWTHKSYYCPHRLDSKALDLKHTFEDEDNPNMTEFQSVFQELKMAVRKSRRIPKENDMAFIPDNPGHNTRKRRIMGHSPKGPELERAFGVFNNTETQDFLTKLTGRSCAGKPDVSPSHYGRGDYSTPHTDFRPVRSLDFVWNLSKDWDPKWGGAFYWGSSKTTKEGYYYPTFNTAILVLPTMTSTHYVTPVNHLSRSRRLSFTWKFSTNKFDGIKSVENDGLNIEDVYGKKENHVQLTGHEATWIARDLDPDTYTEDLERRKKLREMKESVMNDYLNPEDEASFVISWDDDENGESDESGEGDEQAIADEISITAESSILDFLDESILEDTELLSEIRANLRKGKLVVIRDAFKAEFAEYAWSQMNSDNVVWKRDEISPNEIPGSFSTKYAAERSSSSELANVLSVFEHVKSKEFLESISGRSCSGPNTILDANWYKNGDHSNPRHESNLSVQLVWGLVKDWDIMDGGDIFWFPSRTMEGGYNHQTFNTLFLSLPTPSSIYAVTPVAWWAEGKHFSVSALYSARNEDFYSSLKEKPVEEMFANEEDYIGLTEEQAGWIVHEMDAKDRTDDPRREKKLMKLKENISSKYLYPSSDTTYEVSAQLV